MPNEDEKRAFRNMVRQHGKAEQSVSPPKRGDRIDRTAMWSRAMKAAVTGPKVRVEGE